MLSMTVPKDMQAPQVDISTIPMEAHERYMRLAIEEGMRNPMWPFGAVIVDPASDRTVATGANEATDNPIFHGEIVALNNFVRAHGADSRKNEIGNIELSDKVLYSTAEPCPMCMSALIWAGIGGVVFGIGIHRLRELGMDQIMIEASQICAHAPFYGGKVLGGVLIGDNDDLFANRPTSI